MAKIEQLKSNHDQTSSELKKFEKDHAYSHLKIEMLVQRINDLDEKKNQFKKQLITTKSANVQLVKLKNHLEEVNEELIE